MPKHPALSRDPAVDRLRWLLLAAISGAAVAAPACAGRSQAPGGEAGEDSGAGGTSGGSGGTVSAGTSGTGGTVSAGTGGTGGTVSAGTGGTDAGAGGTGAGTGGIAAGTGGTVAGRGGAGMGGAGIGGAGGQPPEGCAAATSSSPDLVNCEGGFVHRPEARACPLPAHDGADPPMPPSLNCAVDADCSAEENGYCLAQPAQPGMTSSAYCGYACETDQDCNAGRICACLGSFQSNAGGGALTLGVCLTATCVSDDDCDPGALCIAPVDSFCGVARPSEFHCQTPADTCAGPADCNLSSYCRYTTDHYECYSRPVCGRPFVVDGAERLAPLGDGRGWTDETRCAVPLAELSAAERASIARHFADAALMEHASIAAFARFTLQLLALGAPSELVLEATRAMADETRHTRDCFGLAARYGHATPAPGPLDVAGALGMIELDQVLELVVLEGCIGESSAAIEAAWAAEAATDPVVREVLAAIAEDEARHAALAFRFVAWAAREDASVLDRVERFLTNAARNAGPRPPEQPTASDARLSAHGVLPLATRLLARSAAVTDVAPAALAALRSELAAPARLELA